MTKMESIKDIITINIQSGRFIEWAIPAVATDTSDK